MQFHPVTLDFWEGKELGTKSGDLPHLRTAEFCFSYYEVPRHLIEAKGNMVMDRTQEQKTYMFQSDLIIMLRA